MTVTTAAYLRSLFLRNQKPLWNNLFYNKTHNIFIVSKHSFKNKLVPHSFNNISPQNKTLLWHFLALTRYSLLKFPLQVLDLGNLGRGLFLFAVSFYPRVSKDPKRWAHFSSIESVKGPFLLPLKMKALCFRWERLGPFHLFWFL